jgi:hypothetical protein
MIDSSAWTGRKPRVYWSAGPIRRPWFSLFLDVDVGNAFVGIGRVTIVLGRVRGISCPAGVWLWGKVPAWTPAKDARRRH